MKWSISRQEIEQIIEAGTMAPSAKNRQPWFFHILYDEKVKGLFLKEIAFGIRELQQKYAHKNIHRPDIERAQKTLKALEQATAIILVSCQKKYNKTFDDGVNWFLQARDIEVADILSIGAAIQNMLLQATEMGYATLWVCDIFYAYPQITDFLKTDDAVVSAICIGKATDNTPKSFRLSVKEVSSYIKSRE